MRKSRQGRRQRGRILSDQDIEAVVKIVDGWTGRLTWQGLIEAIEKRLHSTYTRQALHKHARIHHAFRLKKDELGNQGEAPRRPGLSAEMRTALDQIARLKSEKRRVESENERLLDQFAVWAHNARLHGVDETALNQPLPPVTR